MDLVHGGSEALVEFLRGLLKGIYKASIRRVGRLRYVVTL